MAATTMSIKITAAQPVEEEVKTDPFQEALQEINDRYENDFQRLLQTRPVVQQVDCNGETVFLTHCEKRGRDWVALRSPAMMTNPEFENLRRRAYNEKAALYKAYRG